MIEYIKLFLIALVLAFLQSFIIQEVDMGFWMRPMPYLMLFMILPVNTNKYAQLIIAFIFGTFIDLLSGSFGTHAASCIFMVFFKNLIDHRFVDFDSIQLQGESYINVDTKGQLFFTYYTLSLIFLHHFVFFSLDFFEWVRFFRILGTTLVSTAGSYLLILLFKSIFRR
jgi:rod shape-determining protein MreD